MPEEYKKEEYWLGGVITEIDDEYIEITLRQEFRVKGKMARFAATFPWNGLKWQFHKNDVDPWPSLLHGHCYEKNLVVDAYTGEVFNSSTKQFEGKFPKKGLEKLQNFLSEAKDFSHHSFESKQPTEENKV